MIEKLASLLMVATPLPPPLPVDWAALPEVSYRGATGITYRDSGPVIAMQRQCRFPLIRDGWRGVRADSALLVGADGRLLHIVPDPDLCAPLRRYLIRLYRNRLPGKLNGPASDRPAWYRAAITFSWQH
ncbi:MAG TPA: hypothetical protein VGB08_07960 [Allosphingosinicella sp.]|jgi:hypothetical protein